MADIRMDGKCEWDRRAGEPGRWYERFDYYRALGPGRSIDGAFRVWAADQKAGEPRGQRANRHWYRAAKRWAWRRRAEAFDDAERDVLRAAEAQRRFDARQRRLAIIEAQREAAVHALSVAGLAELNPAQPEDVALAQKLLPSVRLLLTEMMRAERLEYGEATEIVDSGPAVTDEVAAMLDKVYGETAGGDGGGA